MDHCSNTYILQNDGRENSITESTDHTVETRGESSPGSENGAGKQDNETSSFYNQVQHALTGMNRMIKNYMEKKRVNDMKQCCDKSAYDTYVNNESIPFTRDDNSVCDDDDASTVIYMDSEDDQIPESKVANTFEYVYTSDNETDRISGCDINIMNNGNSARANGTIHGLAVESRSVENCPSECADSVNVDDGISDYMYVFDQIIDDELHNSAVSHERPIPECWENGNIDEKAIHDISAEDEMGIADNDLETDVLQNDAEHHTSTLPIAKKTNDASSDFRELCIERYAESHLHQTGDGHMLDHEIFTAVNNLHVYTQSVTSTPPVFGGDPRSETVPESPHGQPQRYEGGMTSPHHRSQSTPSFPNNQPHTTLTEQLSLPQENEQYTCIGENIGLRPDMFIGYHSRHFEPTGTSPKFSTTSRDDISSNHQPCGNNSMHTPRFPVFQSVKNANSSESRMAVSRCTLSAFRNGETETPLDTNTDKLTTFNEQFELLKRTMNSSRRTHNCQCLNEPLTEPSTNVPSCLAMSCRTSGGERVSHREPFQDMGNISNMELTRIPRTERRNNMSGENNTESLPGVMRMEHGHNPTIGISFGHTDISMIDSRHFRSRDNVSCDKEPRIVRPSQIVQRDNIRRQHGETIFSDSLRRISHHAHEHTISHKSITCKHRSMIDFQHYIPRDNVPSDNISHTVPSRYIIQRENMRREHVQREDVQSGTISREHIPCENSSMDDFGHIRPREDVPCDRQHRVHSPRDIIQHDNTRCDNIFDDNHQSDAILRDRRRHSSWHGHVISNGSRDDDSMYFDNMRHIPVDYIRRSTSAAPGQDNSCVNSAIVHQDVMRRYRNVINDNQYNNTARDTTMQFPRSRGANTGPENQNYRTLDSSRHCNTQWRNTQYDSARNPRYMLNDGIPYTNTASENIPNGYHRDILINRNNCRITDNSLCEFTPDYMRDSNNACTHQSLAKSHPWPNQRSSNSQSQIDVMNDTNMGVQRPESRRHDTRHFRMDDSNPLITNNYNTISAIHHKCMHMNGLCLHSEGFNTSNTYPRASNIFNRKQKRAVQRKGSGESTRKKSRYKATMDTDSYNEGQRSDISSSTAKDNENRMRLPTILSESTSM